MSPQSDDSIDSTLGHKISSRTAKVGVVGLGYVGLPTMVASATAGFEVTGIDIVQERVDHINAGVSYIRDVPSDALAPLVKEKKIAATTDYGATGSVDVIVICVPTPISKYREPELGPLQDAVHNLSKHMHGEQLVVLQSTTYPGTTEDLVLPQLQKPSHQVGKHFYLAFSPERIDPGNQQYLIHNIPKVVGGVTPRCGEMAAAFFSTIVKEVIPVSSPKVAEMTKLLENIFRSVNIALVNELAELCRRMDVDIWEIVRAATTKPFGFMPFYPESGWAATAFPWTPSTSPGRPRSTTSTSTS